MSRMEVIIDGESYEIELRQSSDPRIDLIAVVDGEEIPVYIPDNSERLRPEWLVVGDRPYELQFQRELHWVHSHLGRHQIDVRDLDAAVTRPVSGDGRVKAPIPGLVTRIMVEPEQTVEPGAPLFILEAMKMENEIHAPRGGRIAHINVQPGQTVTLGELLVEIE